MGAAAGIIINLVGSICINLGQNLIKLGFNKRSKQQLAPDEKPPWSTYRETIIGWILFAGGNVANFLSFAYAPQSLLAALGVVQFVSNFFFASFVLKEKVTFPVVGATALIIAGCCLLVFFGAKTSAKYTVQDLMRFYRQGPYITYLVLIIVLVAVMFIVYMRGSAVVRANPDGTAVETWKSILPIAYALYCGPIGTQSVLFSKSLSVLLMNTLSGKNQFKFWFTYLVLVFFICSAVFWLTRLSKALKMFPAMVAVPLMQIVWTLFSIISGMLYFQEYKEFKAVNACMYVLGVLVVFVGVYLLTRYNNKPQEASDEYQKMDSFGARHESQEAMLSAQGSFSKAPFTVHSEDTEAFNGAAMKGTPERLRLSNNAPPVKRSPSKQDNINLPLIQTAHAAAAHQEHQQYGSTAARSSTAREHQEANFDWQGYMAPVPERNREAAPDMGPVGQMPEAVRKQLKAIRESTSKVADLLGLDELNNMKVEHMALFAEPASVHGTARSQQAWNVMDNPFFRQQTSPYMVGTSQQMAFPAVYSPASGYMPPPYTFQPTMTYQAPQQLELQTLHSQPGAAQVSSVMMAPVMTVPASFMHVQLPTFASPAIYTPPPMPTITTFAAVPVQVTSSRTGGRTFLGSSGTIPLPVSSTASRPSAVLQSLQSSSQRLQFLGGSSTNLEEPGHAPGRRAALMDQDTMLRTSQELRSSMMRKR